MKYIKLFENYQTYQSISKDQFDKLYKKEDIYVFSDIEISQLESKLSKNYDISVENSSLYKFKLGDDLSIMLITPRFDGVNIMDDKEWSSDTILNIYDINGVINTISLDDIPVVTRYTDMINQSGGYTINNTIIEIKSSSKYYLTKYNNDEWYYVIIERDYDLFYYKCDQIDGIIDLLNSESE